MLSTDLRLAAVLVAVVVLPLGMTAGPGSPQDDWGTGTGLDAVDVGDDRHARLVEEISAIGGVDVDAVFSLVLADEPGAPLLAEIPISAERRLVVLVPFSVRAAGYQVLVPDEDGTPIPHEAGSVRTMRGNVLGAPESVVAGSLTADGLVARILLDDETYWLQPVDRMLSNALDGDHMLYRASGVVPTSASCGLDLIEKAARRYAPRQAPTDGGVAGGTPCVAELACDADVEYFEEYGTVAATEARINLITNLANIQYEQQVGITHQITTILVHTTSDPYTSYDAQTRLCQFITEWTDNQQSIQRDVAQLFTGANLNGSTIGVAADIGDTGICVNIGGCSGGTYGTFGSYCLVQSDFNGVISCAIDLSAHELGHLWGAFHCSCPGNTMNTSITCTNSFGTESINSITTYRDTRLCLDGDCSGGPDVPENDDCADAMPFNGGDGDGTEDYSTIGATTDGPLDDQCQFDGQTYNDIWFSYTATCTGLLTASTCEQLGGSSDYDTDLVVYDGCDCANLVLLGCNDDDDENPCGGGPNYQSTVEIPVMAGGCYLIRVGGWNADDEGNGTLSISCLPDCDAAGDTNGDQVVDVTDLLAVMGQWGATDCANPADVVPDCLVDVQDLILVITSWGPCG